MRLPDLLDPDETDFLTSKDEEIDFLRPFLPRGRPAPEEAVESERLRLFL
jgi:hypothetical protein